MGVLVAFLVLCSILLWIELSSVFWFGLVASCFSRVAFGFLIVSVVVTFWGPGLCSFVISRFS